jgi:hypothetical protein
LRIFSISIPPPISATDRLGGVDLQRHPDRDDAGERAYGDDNDNADDRIGGKKKDEFRKQRRCKGRRDLANDEADQPEHDCLLQDHADTRDWLTHHRARVAGKSPLGEALSYIAKYWDGLCIFLTDGRIEIDNNTVERTIRPITLNRKNALFAGHDAGAENWATIASLIETCKLNAVDPFAYMTATLTAIVNGHKQGRVDELLPWSFTAR